MKTAVLIHGLHLEAHGWESMVWGDLEKNVWGTVPRGIEYAWRVQAEVIVWGSGASVRDGKKEAEVTYELALSRMDDLAVLCGTDSATLKSFVESRSIIDTEANDTAGEIKNTFVLAMERGITDIVLVPVGSQAPIASRRALLLTLEDDVFSQFRHRVMIAPSDGRYEGTSMNDIVIVAPAHRGDRVAIQPNVYARRTLDVIQRMSKAMDADGIQRFLTEWDELIKRYSNSK
jgi:hypothetical protein